MKSLQVRTRIAPTPSGYLHFGNLYSFVLTWILAKSRSGVVVLRIDDLDASRMRRAYLEDIFETLEFAGLCPDEGPSGVEDFLNHFSQQHRLAEYDAILQNLKLKGQLYACTCSRNAILARGEGNIYKGFCRLQNIAMEKAGAAWRIAVPAEEKVCFPELFSGEPRVIFPAIEMGDFVVKRKDGLPAYQVASLADDIRNRINMVVRGQDLLPSTAAQLYLAGVAGFSSFSDIDWYHHPLILDENNRKLSKSAGDTSVRSMRENGMSFQAMLKRIAVILGLKNGNLATVSDLLEEWQEDQIEKDG